MANISEKIKSKQNKIGKMIDKRKEKNNIIKTYFESTPLLSVDIENTLVPKKRRIFLVNKEDRKSIKDFAQKGGVVLINSGGTYGYCKKVAKSAKVKTIISSNNGAFVAIPEQTDRPIISLRVSPENIYRIKDKLEQVEPRAIIALSGKDRKYYIDNKGAKIRLFQMQQAFKFRNRYRISTNKKKFEDMALKTYSIQIFPMPDTYGLTKNTKPIKKEQQKNITLHALNALQELMIEDYKLNGQPSFKIEEGDMGLQICHPKASKLNAIKAIVEMKNQQSENMQITQDNIFAVGDGVQDLCSVAIMQNPDKQFFTMNTATNKFYENSTIYEKHFNANKLQNKIENYIKQAEIINAERENKADKIKINLLNLKLEPKERFSFKNNIVPNVKTAIDLIDSQTKQIASSNEAQPAM